MPALSSLAAVSKTWSLLHTNLSHHHYYLTKNKDHLNLEKKQNNFGQGPTLTADFAFLNAINRKRC